MTDSSAPLDDAPPTRTQTRVLLTSILIVALCGIAYELIIGTISSYLVGDSVWQFSITIGLFMFAMGIGSFLSQGIRSRLLSAFITVELALAAIGGLSSIILFFAFPLHALYKPVMYGLILVIGTLVGLEIPLLTRILSRHDDLREAIANVLGIDYVGALLGSLIFPLLLLPSLGLFRASFAIGLLNIGVAIVSVIVFRERLRRPGWLLAGALLVMALLIGLTVGATALTRFAEGQLYLDRIVWQRQSPYQRLVLTASENTGNLRLYLNGHVQFAERDEYRYHEALVHPILAASGPRARVLILGGGDGLAAREVLRHDGVERIDIVDIDPAVTELCRTFPRIVALNEGALDDPRVHLHHRDAFEFVRTDDGARWDRVIIDLPDPHTEVLGKLYSVEFYRLLARRIEPGGLIVSQSSSPFFTREVFWTIGATMREAGFDTLPYHITVPAFGDWGFQLGAIGRTAPRTFRFDLPTRFLTAEVMAAAQVFAADVADPGATPNSMFEPRLQMLYAKGIRNF